MKRISPEDAVRVFQSVFSCAFVEGELHLAAAVHDGAETWAFCVQDPDDPGVLMPVLFLQQPGLSVQQDPDSDGTYPILFKASNPAGEEVYPVGKAVISTVDKTNLQ